MKFNDYNDYLDHYVGDFKCLGEYGDYAYYYDEDNNHVVKILAESAWNGKGLRPTTFYNPLAVEKIKEVWDNELDYDTKDEMIDELEFAESLEN